MHALLSPSSAARWLECTPSARLEADLPDRAGDAASEGTLAHTLGELIIKRQLKIISEVTYKRQLKAVQANRFYSDLMLDHCEDYAHYVIKAFGEAQNKTKDAKILLEELIDLSMYIPEGFGTGDVLIVADHVCDFIDLKYGKGILVEATNNRQMILYSLGIVEKYSILFDIREVRMTIYQPRINNFSTWSIDTKSLLIWAEEELKPKAKLAWEGKGNFVPGKHCQFCRVKATCKANSNYQMELAKHAFEEPKLMTPEDVAEVLLKANEFRNWLKAVETHALYESVLNDVTWPGMKLVEGRSNRYITDTAKVISIMKKANYSSDVYLSKPSLLGIGALEKNLGKKELNTLIGKYIDKPVGSPTLVSEDDKRPPFNASAVAADIFNDDVTDL